jgi:glycosyltransferase involved in cell wall biosynthesis
MNSQISNQPIWLLSPYNSGSHRSWANGYLRHSRHRIEPFNMAGRFWKWRMQGGAMEMAVQARRALLDGPAPAAILTTDMLNLPTWLGLMRRDLTPIPPVVLYMHENQLTYPWRPGEKPDLTYAMINWLSQLSADRIWFNSDYHLQSWFEELPRLLKHYPDYTHLELVTDVRGRSQVMPVGIDCKRIDTREARLPEAGAPPLIVWNQRWEYDKRPDRFFQLLYHLQEDGIDFRLAVAGENFRNIPAEFDEARRKLQPHIIHWGFVPGYDEYSALLASADLVISTADHEFFGISILEAIWAGAFPLLPRRLSYPELIPQELHPAALYDDDEQLLSMARQRLLNPRPAPPSLRRHVGEHFAWPKVAAHYDAALSMLLE